MATGNVSSGPLNARQQPMTDFRLTVSIPERNTGFSSVQVLFSSFIPLLAWLPILDPCPCRLTSFVRFLLCRFSLLVTGCDAGWSSCPPCCFPGWLARISMSSRRGCVLSPGSCASGERDFLQLTIKKGGWSASW